MTYWDISTAFYSGKSLYVGDLSYHGSTIRFKPDGLIMYLLDYYSNIIYQYTLSISWDITTAVYSGKYFDLGKQDSNTQDISFNPDGSIMYMLGKYTLTVQNSILWIFIIIRSTNTIYLSPGILPPVYIPVYPSKHKTRIFPLEI